MWKPWPKLMSSFSRKWWNLSSLNSTKKSLRNSFPQALLAPTQWSSTTKSLQGLALKSLWRFLQKWPAFLLTALVVSLLRGSENLSLTQSASMSLKKPVGLMRRHTMKAMMKIHFSIPLLSELCNFRLSRVPNNPYDSIRMLNIDKGTVLVDNRLKIL